MKIKIENRKDNGKGYDSKFYFPVEWVRRQSSEEKQKNRSNSEGGYENAKYC